MSDPVAVRDSAGRIVTARLRLRQWADADRAPFAAMGRDPRVMAHFPTLLRLDESESLIVRQRRSIASTGLGFWAIERLADNRFLGFTGVRPVTLSSPIHGETEIGWRLAREFWGVGYAVEAARAALHVAFVERRLPSVVAMTVPANARSRGVMERLGMVRRPDLDFGHPDLPAAHPLHPHIVYGIDNPDPAEDA
jgi:RimJ/RimL family protein N-acetyltransferase